MSSLTSFDSPLFIRDQRRRYRPANADQVLEAARRVVDQRMQRGTSFSDPSVAGRFFRDKLAGLEREVFAAVFLDCRHRLIDYAELFFGTIDGAEVHPRELVKQALMLNAAAVLIAHNHPSGEPEPSAADRALTARLKQALSLVDVRLLDHFVIGGHVPLSMAARGWV
jgi:DNA repair protein RadC